MLHPTIMDLIQPSEIEVQLSQVLLLLHNLHKARDMLLGNIFILIQVDRQLGEWEFRQDINESQKMPRIRDVCQI